MNPIQKIIEEGEEKKFRINQGFLKGGFHITDVSKCNQFIEDTDLLQKSQTIKLLEGLGDIGEKEGGITLLSKIGETLKHEKM